MHSPYKTSGIYAPDKISKKAYDIKDSPDYFDKLLYGKICLVKKYVNKYSINRNIIIDLGCATGDTLQLFSEFEERIGIDFSNRYIEYAKTKWKTNGMRFIEADMTDLPVLPLSDVVYSLSTIYYISDFIRVIQNLKKILKPNGIVIFDLGNKRSINTICSDIYTAKYGWAQQMCGTIDFQMRILKKEGFDIIKRHSFQILPYWASEPYWLKLFLLPWWKNIMSKRIKFCGNKMLDEIISSLPIINKFAFRHIVVCKNRRG
jgi:SAM-dependent methyltransferase